MIGTACPSESTSRSLLGFHGSFGSQRIWWYINTDTRCASDSALEGWPLPAAVVISTLNLPMSMALRLTALTKLMWVSGGGGGAVAEPASRPIASRGRYSMPRGVAIRHFTAESTPEVGRRGFERRAFVSESERGVAAPGPGWFIA